MRILVVSDIHGNRPALQALREEADAVLCLGDIVEYGPQPSACIDWVRERATHTVRGNHDHGTAQNVDIHGHAGFRYLTMATRKATIERISPADRRFLADLPTTKMVTLGGLRFFLVHATPRDPLDEYCPGDAKLWEARLANIKADFVCVGHTHTQFLLNVKGTRVLNPGSVGLSRDGDPRARYAVIEDGEVTLKQADYPVEETVKAVEAWNIEARAKAMLADVYRTGKYVAPTAAAAEEP
jgi:putative phosphoesterase